MGSLHPAEHAAIGIMPLLALGSKRPGGLSTLFHPQTGGAVIFIYDGIPGGAGLNRQAYLQIGELFLRAENSIAVCECEKGCGFRLRPAAHPRSSGNRSQSAGLPDFARSFGQGNTRRIQMWQRSGRIALVRQRRIRELVEYCRQDVGITRDLYRYALNNGYLLFQDPKEVRAAHCL